MCRYALDKLAELDRSRSTELLRGAGSVSRLLEETGRPILVEFGNVRVSGLSPERTSRNVGEQLTELADMGERGAPMTCGAAKRGQGAATGSGRVIEQEITPSRTRDAQRLAAELRGSVAMPE